MSSNSARELSKKRMPTPTKTTASTADETAPLPKVARDSLSQQVAERLGIGIVTGKFDIGALLPNETDLGRDLRVSRTAYREAIKFLSAKGLVEARPKSGTRVADRAHWNILDPDLLRWSLHSVERDHYVRDLFELRRFIEPNAAKLAAERRTQTQLDAIAAALHGLETRVPYSEPHIEADLAFHNAIFDAAGNSALSCLKSVVGTTLHWSMRLQTGKERGAFATSMADHRRVYEAIAIGDGDRAHSIMTTLVLDALTDTREALARQLAVANGTKPAGQHKVK
jgi:GntR family transcriptional regulator, galactonate operon transcriptional repressor